MAARNFFAIIVDVETAGAEALAEVENLAKECFSPVKGEICMTEEEWKSFLGFELLQEDERDPEEEKSLPKRFAESEVIILGLLAKGTQGLKNFQQISVILDNFPGMYCGKNPEQQEHMSARTLTLSSFERLMFN